MDETINCNIYAYSCEARWLEVVDLKLKEVILPVKVVWYWPSISLNVFVLFSLIFHNKLEHLSLLTSFRTVNFLVGKEFKLKLLYYVSKLQHYLNRFDSLKKLASYKQSSLLHSSTSYKAKNTVQCQHLETAIGWSEDQKYSINYQYQYQIFLYKSGI